jgi:transcriptional regulator with XRE-family HTH domain
MDGQFAAMAKRLRPLTRVEEVRKARGFSKAELARRAGMPAQTLQNIEDGKTKGVSVSARKLLAPVLGVREDVLLLPVGHPFDPSPPLDTELLAGLLRDLATVLREEARGIKDERREEARAIASVLEAIKDERREEARAITSVLEAIKDELRAMREMLGPRSAPAAKEPEGGCAGCATVGSAGTTPRS